MKTLTINKAEEWVIGRIVIPAGEEVKRNVIEAQLKGIVDDDMESHGDSRCTTVNTVVLKVFVVAKRHAYELDKFEDNEGRTIYQLTRITYNVEED